MKPDSAVEGLLVKQLGIPLGEECPPAGEIDHEVPFPSAPLLKGRRSPGNEKKMRRVPDDRSFFEFSPRNASPDATKLIAGRMHPPIHKSSTGDFFPALDGIRGFAVLGVVIYHIAYFNPSSPLQNALWSFTKTGFMGVPMFFVLSGFLISFTVIKSRERFSAKEYAFRRAAKILPPFLISLILFSLLALVWKDPQNIWLSALAYLFTLPNFTSGWDGINPVYWSLMVEIHFYIAFPILYFLIRKVSPRAELWCALILLVVPTAIRLCHHLPLNSHKDAFFWNA